LNYDDPHLVANFGRLLRIRDDARILAASVLWALEEKHRLGIQPELRVQRGAFYGTHLRTAADAKAAGWTPYSIQSQNYFSQASKHNVPVIYVVGGMQRM